MKKFVKEFKEFALKGNMIDLAVGMIIGSAFTAVVNSLVNNIFNPVIALLTGGIDLTNSLIVPIGEIFGQTGEEAAKITFGAFISDLIKFIIMAFVIFLFVRLINRLRNADATLKAKKEGKKEEVKAPTTKICPYCKSEIAIDATRCPHCTSELDK